MALIDEQFPQLAAFGTIGGPNWNTSIVELDSGAEQRLIRWPVGRHQYDVQGAITTLSDYKSVRDFHWIAKGKGNYFRFKDLTDYKTADTVTHTDCELVDANGAVDVGDGSTTEFYLAKKYTVGSSTIYRPITLPVESTVKIGIDSVLQTVTTDYTVDATTGKITFTSAPLLNEVLTGGCEFDVPCRFNDDFLPGEIVNKSGDEFLIGFSIELIEVWL